MQHVRWYDKNQDLKDVFEFIEGLDEDIQAQIAQDILQILMSEFGINLDSRINTVTQNCTYNYKRWYDDNRELFTSFEIVKEFPEQLKEEVAKKIVDSIVYIYAEGKLNG